eukprot:8016314-Pyramimonas_sp.AAC.1
MRQPSLVCSRFAPRHLKLLQPFEGNTRRGQLLQQASIRESYHAGRDEHIISQPAAAHPRPGAEDPD